MNNKFIDDFEAGDMFPKSLLSLIFGVLILLLPAAAQSQEFWSDVSLMTPPHWNLRAMQHFSGSVPSKAWLFSHSGKNGENTDEEVIVSVLITEGIEHGLEGQDVSNLAKLYIDALVIGWGGKIANAPAAKTPEAAATGTPYLAATFCAGEAGYKLTATFGDKEFDYYGCMLQKRDRMRMVSVATWVPTGTAEEDVAHRLMTFVQAVSFAP